MKIASEKVVRHKNLRDLSILLAIALCIGIHLIVSTVLIAKDGLTFINYAQQLNADPVRTMSNQYQHPGYPLMILAAHKGIGLFCNNTSNMSWIYYAQSITLFFRLLSIVILYFIGKQLVGAKLSFWAVLILIFLPAPAKYGSDVLSDWPHLFLLSFGFLVLLKAASTGRWWLFPVAGMVSGVGYLIRPECAQLVIIGGLWLGINFIFQKSDMCRYKTVLAGIFLILGFLIVSTPYMKLKGAVFPKKNVGSFTSADKQTETSPVVTASVIANTPMPKIAKAVEELMKNAAETLMWFFLGPVLTGIYFIAKRRKWYQPENFFVLTLVVLNISIMAWLYCKHGYMSQRHTLPMFIFLTLYATSGLEIWGTWLQEKFQRKNTYSSKNNNRHFWFLVLLAIGILICTPKLLRPLRIDKQCYRAAAQWLQVNTNDTDIIAVPDKRITYYSSRRSKYYINPTDANDAQYIVIVSSKKSMQEAYKPPNNTDILYTDNSGGKHRIDIYKISN